MPRGGKREGAGRPVGSTKPKVRTKVSFRMQIKLIEWLKKRSIKNHRPQITLIEDAIKKHYKIKGE